MSDASDFLKKWVRKNITPTTAHIHNDTLTAGRLAEECLWEAQGENLSGAEVNEAATGNLLTFMVSALNRAGQNVGDRSVWRSVSLTILVRLKVMCSWST